MQVSDDALIEMCELEALIGRVDDWCLINTLTLQTKDSDTAAFMMATHTGICAYSKQTCLFAMFRSLSDIGTEHSQVKTQVPLLFITLALDNTGAFPRAPLEMP